MLVTGFLPLINNESEIIIVGTLPGTISIKKQEYYADLSNQFWSLMECALNIAGLRQLPYKQKCEQLLNNNIALWDVLKSAERIGSTDGGFVKGTEKINDFNSFIQQYDNIRKVVIAGGTAADYYRKGVISGLIPAGLSNVIVQSTSATPGKYVLPFLKKCEQWRGVIT